LKKVYIAYSVHGTNTYLVATAQWTNSQYKKHLQSKLFAVTASRWENYSEESNGVKLLYSGLMNYKGTPLRSAPHILNRFNTLVQDYGFTIVEQTRKKFIAYHWRKKEKIDSRAHIFD
jgi:hypothetical protein